MTMGKRSRKVRKVVGMSVGGAVAVAAVLTGRALAAPSSSSGSYRTAVATMASVTQTIQRPGTSNNSTSNNSTNNNSQPSAARSATVAAPSAQDLVADQS